MAIESVVDNRKEIWMDQERLGKVGKKPRFI